MFPFTGHFELIEQRKKEATTKAFDYINDYCLIRLPLLEWKKKTFTSMIA